MSDSNKKKENSLVNFIKRYFFTGLLISAPIGATIYITIFIVEFFSELYTLRNGQTNFNKWKAFI